MRIFIQRFFWTVALLVALVVGGTAGYVALWGRDPIDAVYMTIITITAVGYQEVWPLTRVERVYTMLLLLGGITWMGFWFANLTSLIVEMDLTDALRRRKTMKDIAGMQDHVIVCGAGRTGRQVAQELERMDSAYVIIEKDRDRIVEIQEFLPKALVVEGDATHDQVLFDAGLLRARGLVACLSADTDNLFVCLTARDLAATIKIVARAYEEETMDKLYRAGADHVVSPNVSSAIRMASVLVRPSVVSFLDIATRSSNLALRLEEVVITEDSPLAGRSLKEAAIPSKTGLIVIAIRQDHGIKPDYTFNPVADTRLEAGDHIIVMGTPEQIDNLRELTA